MDDDDVDVDDGAEKLAAKLAVIDSDKAWWESVLPKGWYLLGWTDKRSATICSKQRPHISMELNGKFVKDLKRDWNI